jgi:hypothetical protein
VTESPHFEVVHKALEVLAEHLPGYTDPDLNGHQAHLHVVASRPGVLTVEVIRSSDLTRLRFDVGVSICPAPEPTTLRRVETSRDEASGRGRVPSRDESGVVRPVPRSGYGT